MLDFFSQFNFLPGRILERVTQKIAESDEHTDRGVVFVVTNKTDDAVQCVEEKMRVQLHSQCVELRLRELGFESRGHNLTLPVLAIVVKRITDTDHATIDQ